MASRALLRPDKQRGAPQSGSQNQARGIRADGLGSSGGNPSGAESAVESRRALVFCVCIVSKRLSRAEPSLTRHQNRQPVPLSEI
jgi:hypothetical protein